MDYLLSRGVYASKSRNHLLKLGRSFGKPSLLTKLVLRDKTKFKKLNTLDDDMHN